MDEIVIRNSKGAAGCGLLILFPFAVLGAYLVYQQNSLMNWLVFLLFAGLCAVCLWLYFDRRPRIVINEQGIEDKRTKMGAIEWRDITNLSIVRMKNTQHLQIKVAEPSKYFARMSKIQKIGTKIDTLGGLDELSINVTGLEISADKIAEIIAERVSSVKS